jgi:CDP-paratose 2-epimerase
MKPHADPVAIIGGAGFVGTNLAHRLAQAGRTVRILDHFARRGSRQNAAWLEKKHRTRVTVRQGDVRNRRAVEAMVDGASVVYHLAGQVAVTQSLNHPAEDFQVNLAGTVQLLEVLRQQPRPAALIYTSTNKVYGDLASVPLVADGDRWEPRDEALRQEGISEAQPLSFHSPYGCSKGGADQYVLDYARSFGLRTLVLRMSCVYGPHQFGTEDQGWVAHFLLRALRREPITIFGDGRQVRDLLYVDDLVDALVAAEARMPRLTGRPFNLGGTPRHSASLRQVLGEIAELCGEAPTLEWADWRPGDQRYYTSDTRAFARETGWRPQVGISEGLKRLFAWLLESRNDVRLPARKAAAPGEGDEVPAAAKGART